MTCTRSINTILVVFSAALLFLLSQGVQAAPTVAGRVILATGKAKAILTGKTERTLKRGSNVFEGDSISTDDKSYLKIKYTDGGFMMIRPSSKLVIEKYVPLEKGDGSQITSLVKGGMRVVTGAIGKTNQKNVMVKSTPATIGIRGTDWTMRICSDRPGVDANPESKSDCADLAELGVPTPKNGLYSGVNDGSISITNGRGTLVAKRGEYAYVRGPDTAPAPLPTAPAILAVDAIPDPKSDNSTDFIKSSTCR